MHYIFDVLKML